MPRPFRMGPQTMTYDRGRYKTKDAVGSVSEGKERMARDQYAKLANVTYNEPTMKLRRTTREETSARRSAPDRLAGKRPVDDVRRREQKLRQKYGEARLRPDLPGSVAKPLIGRLRRSA